jgi:hypothetical protein
MEEAIEIQAGSVVLEGLLSLAGAPKSGAVVCHPHPLRGGDMHNNVVSGLVTALARAGIATLRFNFRGAGRSGGVHDDGNAEQGDVDAAVDCLLARSGLSAVAVAGYSFGAMVGLRAGAANPRVSKLVGVGPVLATRDFSFLEPVTKPKLLISGDRDDYCPLAALKSLFERLAEPKSLTVIEGADHFFHGREAQAGEAAARFLSATA